MAEERTTRKEGAKNEREKARNAENKTAKGAERPKNASLAFLQDFSITATQVWR